MLIFRRPDVGSLSNLWSHNESKRQPTSRHSREGGNDGGDV
jgi:hypothetical protein